MEKLSQSLEDYLEAIVMLGGTTERSVRPSDIARKLEVSKTSVGKALSSLRERGYVTQPYYGEATLTAKGLEYGESVLKRHQYLTAFLVKAIGIPEETAEEEACMMEHAISNESFEKWAAYIERLGLV
jgi:Mn-dependent DtxR family transcriptional regulator